MAKYETVKVATGSIVKNNRQEADFTYSFPETIEEAIQILGEPAVLAEFHHGYTLTLQIPARKTLLGITTPVSKEENSRVVQTAMDAYVYGVKAPRAARKSADPVADLANAWPGLSPERRAEIAAMFGMTLPGTDNGGASRRARS